MSSTHTPSLISIALLGKLLCFMASNSELLQSNSSDNSEESTQGYDMPDNLMEEELHEVSVIIMFWCLISTL